MRKRRRIIDRDPEPYRRKRKSDNVYSKKWFEDYINQTYLVLSVLFFASPYSKNRDEKQKYVETVENIVDDIEEYFTEEKITQFQAFSAITSLFLGILERRAATLFKSPAVPGFRPGPLDVPMVERLLHDPSIKEKSDGNGTPDNP